MEKIKNLLGKIKLNKDSAINILIVVVVIAIGVFIYLSYRDSGGGIKVISLKEAGAKTVDYINNNFLTTGTDKATYKSGVEANGMYKITFDYQSQDNEVYVTRDGKLFFPVIPSYGVPTDMSAVAPTPAPSTSNQTTKSCEEIKKADKAELDAFIVSKCPYGLQMQRVLAEIIKNVPDLKENIKVRYIGEISGGKVVSMHDEAPGGVEAQENLRQICLREETSKYWDYTSCFIKKGDTNGCLTSAGVDTNALNACMTDANRGLKYAQEDFTIAGQNKVGGSPTLIMNGEGVSESWFGGRTAEGVKNLLCCGFNAKLGVCSQKLSEDKAASGFSETYAGTGTGGDASCGQ